MLFVPKNNSMLLYVFTALLGSKFLEITESTTVISFFLKKKKNNSRHFFFERNSRHFLRKKNLTVIAGWASTLLAYYLYRGPLVLFSWPIIPRLSRRWFSSRLLLVRSLARYGGCDGGRSGRRGRRRLPDNLLSPLPQ